MVSEKKTTEELPREEEIITGILDPSTGIFYRL